MIDSDNQQPSEIATPPEKSIRWAHYAFEFVMLFLAVTLGFFVENQREKLSARDDEKRLVATLLNDVTTDIQRVDEIIQLRTERIQKNDSLYLLLFSSDRSKYMNEIYDLMINARSHRTLFYLSNTMNYLANGGFQRFSSSAVEDETRQYYLVVQDLLAAQQSSLDIGQEMIEKSRRLLDAEVMFALRYPELKKKPVIDLYSAKPDEINQYANALLHFNGNSGAQIQFLRKIREQGEKLTSSIKKEYKL